MLLIAGCALNDITSLCRESSLGSASVYIVGGIYWNVAVDGILKQSKFRLAEYILDINISKRPIDYYFELMHTNFAF